ncbi:MAG TPA: NAD-dependent epimerase/dehydratase family protein [Candidatus Binatia bacterium]|nr:NAD-dependent epimerase/dehydratase family protein [Candidatus Binatia bacterium]
MKRLLVTGSSGLIGSEAVTFFEGRGWEVHGVDNNMRREFFGPDGDTTWNLERLRRTTTRFTHHDLDVRAREAIAALVARVRPELVIHAAAQPSHDLAKDRPFDDFETNATGTLNLLEAVRRTCPESPFIFMSTNKVYGDAPNEIPLVELATRWDYARPEDYHGIREDCRVDACLHSLFGASKLAADVMVQEYGRYFGIPTVCFRGGCLTGPHHSGAELHGFLAYLARATREGRPYRIYGYRGKQVRDNIHSYDVCEAFLAFYQRPRVAAVYNLGGGRANSVSMLEAVARFEDLIGRKLQVEYLEQNRVGDHICYISDLRRLQGDYPGWGITRSLDDIFREIAGAGTAAA